jgi:hypothetical protein
MQTQNRLILALKTAALNHKQVKEVLIGVEADIATSPVTYPLCRIWADGFALSTNTPKTTTYRFAVAVMDRHREDFTDAVEVLSDTAAIIQDIISTLIYVYREESVEWQVNDTAQAFYDDKTDIVAGHAIVIEARVAYNRDFCSVPSNDYDFPSIDITDLSIIDEGHSDTTYMATLIIDGGIA